MRYFHDVARAFDDSFDGVSASTYYYGRSTISYNDYAGFAQYDLDTRWLNLSVGGRYEYYSPVGGHFVPRVALTKAWQKFHLKALYSQASRIPGINVEQAASDGVVKPEQTSDYEIEAGYQFNDSLSLVGNIFYTQLDKPIIYTADTAGGSSDGYYNGTKISTAGMESQLRWDQPQFSSSLSCSFYRAIDNAVAYVRGDEGSFLAAPTVKVTASGTWHLMKSLDWNNSGYWISDRQVYAYPAAGVTSLPPEFIMNTFLNYKFKYASIGLGVQDLLNVNRYAPQPYAGGSGPLPLKGREVFLKLQYTF